MPCDCSEARNQRSSARVYASAGLSRVRCVPGVWIGEMEEIMTPMPRPIRATAMPTVVFIVIARPSAVEIKAIWHRHLLF